MVMFVLFYGVADIHWFVCVDVLEIWSHVECDRRDHAACAVIFEFEFDVLEIFAYEFGRAEVKDVTRTKHRFLVAWSEWIELFQACHKFWGDVGESDVGVDFELRTELVRLDMLCDIFLEKTAEFRYVLFL